MSRVHHQGLMWLRGTHKTYRRPYAARGQRVERFWSMCYTGFLLGLQVCWVSFVSLLSVCWQPSCILTNYRHFLAMHWNHVSNIPERVQAGIVTGVPQTKKVFKFDIKLRYSESISALNLFLFLWRYFMMLFQWLKTKWWMIKND